MNSKFAKNSILNFLGAATPAIANLFSVPVLVKSLGEANYGLLTLVLALIGYFSLLDINVTQGSTRFIAEYDSLNQTKKTNEVISFGLLIYLVIGLVGMIAIYTTAPLLVVYVFDISVENRQIAQDTLKIAAIAFFFTQLQSYLVSIPQAMQRWDLSATVEAIFGSFAPIISMMVALYTYNIKDVVAARLILSVFNVAILIIIIIKIRPNFSISKTSKSIRSRILMFSAFSYLSTIASVTHAYADRMILGMLLGLSEITLYSIPTSLVNRLFGMTFRLGSIIYPATSELASQGNQEKIKHIYLLASRYLTAINSFLALLIIIYGQDILKLWIGEQFVEKGYPIMVITTLAMLIETLTNLPSLVNNAIAHPKTTGYFTLLRALLGIAALIVGTYKYGIVGTALGHLIASSFLVIIFIVYVHGRIIPATLTELIVKAYLPVITVISITSVIAWFTKPSYPVSIEYLVLHGLIVSAIYCFMGLIIVLTSEHKKLLLNKLTFR